MILAPLWIVIQEHERPASARVARGVRTRDRRASATSTNGPRPCHVALPIAAVEGELDDEIVDVAENVVESVELTGRARRLAMAAHVNGQHAKALCHTPRDVIPALAVVA